MRTDGEMEDDWYLQDVKEGIIIASAFAIYLFIMIIPETHNLIDAYFGLDITIKIILGAVGWLILVLLAVYAIKNTPKEDLEKEEQKILRKVTDTVNRQQKPYDFQEEVTYTLLNPRNWRLLLMLAGGALLVLINTVYQATIQIKIEYMLLIAAGWWLIFILLIIKAMKYRKEDEKK